jgi:hypothetical protein
MTASTKWAAVCAMRRAPQDGQNPRRLHDANLINRLLLAMLANGVDIMGGPGGIVSATHGPREVALTLRAFRSAVQWLQAEGDIKDCG